MPAIGIVALLTALAVGSGLSLDWAAHPAAQTGLAKCSTQTQLSTDLYAGPLRLLSAPEQDVVLRELLAESPEAVQWPAELQRASQTRGFAHEVASVLGLGGGAQPGTAPAAA